MVGTLINYVGSYKIKEDKFEEYIDRVLKILRYGGMVQFNTIKMFGSEIGVVNTPMPDKNGDIYFDYNNIGDETWETAHFNINNGRFHSNKVGNHEFNDVCSAIYVLTEFYTEEFGFATENGDIYDARLHIGWLNYLFDEKYTNERALNAWRIYELLQGGNEADMKNHNRCYNAISSVCLTKFGSSGKTDLSSFITFAYVTQDYNELWSYFSEYYNEKKTINRTLT